MRERSGNLELPDVHEIVQLVNELESPRLASRPEWLEENSDVLSSFRELCSVAGLNDIFDFDRTSISSEQDLAQAILLQEQMKAGLMAALEKNTFDGNLLKSVYEALAEVDLPELADAIFVFGAPSNARIDRAVELFNEGYSKKIIISGKGPNWQSDVQETEATRMAERAIELGIAEDAIVVETESLTIPDNTKRTIDLFESTAEYPNSLIIVSSPFVMLRSYIEWMKFPPRPIRIFRNAPPIQDPNKSVDLWHTNPDGRNIVVNEYAKIFGESCVDYFLRNQRTDDSDV